MFDWNLWTLYYNKNMNMKIWKIQFIHYIIFIFVFIKTIIYNYIILINEKTKFKVF